MAQLGDVCEIVTGTTPKSGCPEYWDGDINWVTPAELTDDTDVIYETQRKITRQAVIDSSLKFFPRGTVLLSSRAPIGKVAIAGTEMYCNQGFKNLICSDKIYNRYLFHFLRSKTQYLNSLGRGATFKEISKRIVADIEIPLPPLDEQRKIAAVLDKISDLTDKRRRQLDKLDELEKSRFMEQFGDYNADTLLEKVCTQLPQNGFYRKGAEIDGNIPIVKMKQLFGFESMEKATNCDLVAMTDTEREKFRLTPHDLLFGRRSLVLAGAGKCRRAGNITHEIVFESSLLRVSLDKNVMRPIFLQHWFDTSDGINAIIAIRSVTTIAGIKGSDLVGVKVPVPPIELQDKFLNFVGRTDKIKSTIQRSLRTLETLKKSLMQEYFSAR